MCQKTISNKLIDFTTRRTQKEQKKKLKKTGTGLLCSGLFKYYYYFNVISYVESLVPIHAYKVWSVLT